MERLPYIAVLVSYGFLSVIHLLPGIVSERARSVRLPVGVIGVIIHALTLAWAALGNAHPPGFPEALAATSLGLGVAYVFATRSEDRLGSVGMLLSPMALVLLGTAMVVPSHRVVALEQTGFSYWLPVHLGLIFSGIGGFAFSSIVGAFYLVVRRRLKQKRFDGLRRLPSLETLDRMQFRAMLFGFVFLTLGIGAGGAWAAASLQEAWTFDPKVLFTLCIWLWYGIALQVRLVAGRRGRWTALFSIVGFAGLMFSLLGMNFVLSGWHGYG